jgi:hypothetical protein
MEQVIPPGFTKPVVTPLDEIYAFVSRFIYASEAELVAITLWIAHTYVYKLYFATPRLGVFAPGEDSGKTTVLRMLLALACNAVMTPNASAPSIYKIIEQEHPTLCFDEADGIWGKSGTGERGRVLRGILNEGAYQDGFVLRVVGNDVVRFPCFGPAAFAGIGKLPKTMMSRCVEVHLLQAPMTAEIDDYEPDLYRAEAKRIREGLREWLTDRGPELNLRPEMPHQMFNRQKQIARVLVALGDLASEEWGKRAREAVLELFCNITGKPHISTGMEFIQTVAAATQPDAKMPTGELIKMMATQRKLHGRCAWADWLEEPTVAPRKIAALLRPYGIETQQFWLNKENRRGYAAADFHMWAKEEDPHVDQPESDEFERQVEAE